MLRHRFVLLSFQPHCQVLSILHHRGTNHKIQTRIDRILKPFQRGQYCGVVRIPDHWPAHVYVWHIVHAPHTSETPPSIGRYRMSGPQDDHLLPCPSSEMIATAGRDWWYVPIWQAQPSSDSHHHNTSAAPVELTSLHRTCPPCILASC